MLRLFANHSTLENRAVQLYLLLIGRAANHQLTNYQECGRLMGFTSANNAAGIMGNYCAPIAFWCKQKGLPPLTALVVTQDSGLPGLGYLDAGRLQEWPDDLQKIFAFNWYSIIPPTAAELDTALRLGRVLVRAPAELEA